MKEVIVRTLSGVLYISIILFAMFTSGEWFMGLFFILALITMSEFMKLVGLKGIFPYLLLLAGFYFLSYRVIHPYPITVFLLLVLFVNTLLFLNLFESKDTPLLINNKYITTIFYVIGGFVFLTSIPKINEYNTFMPHIIISIFALMWANDTFAYLIGKKFGKHKLLERISPKKTIEGFIGGLAGALLIAFAVFYILNYYLDKNSNYSLWIWLCLAVIISTTGTVGDLIQSKYKRRAGVKDSGIIMPGHGGMYDRLDSIIYASPFVYAFLLVINYVS